MTKRLATSRSIAFQRAASSGKIQAFLGYEPEGVITFPPKKKPRQQKLTVADKQRNRQISSERIEIEHRIGGSKRCNIVVHPLRSRTDHDADDVMKTACGLHNFRLNHRQLAIA